MSDKTDRPAESAEHLVAAVSERALLVRGGAVAARSEGFAGLIRRCTGARRQDALGHSTPPPSNGSLGL
jgi:hypothetical protein